MCRRSEYDLYARTSSKPARTNSKPARSLVEVLRDLSGRAGRRWRRRKWSLSRLRSRPATKRPTAKVPRQPEARPANQACVGPGRAVDSGLHHARRGSCQPGLSPR